VKADMICAWCDKKMGDTETFDGKPSHGICLPCLKAPFPDLYLAITTDRATQTANQFPPALNETHYA